MNRGKHNLKFVVRDSQRCNSLTYNDSLSYPILLDDGRFRSLYISSQDLTIHTTLQQSIYRNNNRIEPQLFSSNYKLFVLLFFVLTVTS